MARHLISVDLLPTPIIQSNTTTVADGGRTFLARDNHAIPLAFISYELPVDAGTYPAGVQIVSVHFPGFMDRLHSPAEEQRRITLSLQAEQPGGATQGFDIDETREIGLWYVAPGGEIRLNVTWPSTVFPAPLDYAIEGGLQGHVGHILIDDLLPVPGELIAGGDGKLVSIGPTI